MHCNWNANYKFAWTARPTKDDRLVEPTKKERSRILSREGESHTNQESFFHDSSGLRTRGSFRLALQLA